MLRVGAIVIAVVAAGLVLPGSQAEAAGRVGTGPAVRSDAAAGPRRGFAPRVAGPRRDGGVETGRFRERRYARGSGLYWPWYYPTDAGSQTIVLDEREPAAPRDPHSFDGMPVRLGIARSPTPEPTLYQIEGPRDRPVTRAIRIADAEPAGGKRSRFMHAETGALLLTVPGR